METIFPEIVTSLPEVAMPFEGVRAYLVQGTAQQMVFMEFENPVDVPAHSHAAQWGIVLEGEMILTVGSIEKRLCKGDTYFIPEGGEHSARIRAGYRDLTLFNDAARYKTKTPNQPSDRTR